MPDEVFDEMKKDLTGIPKINSYGERKVVVTNMPKIYTKKGYQTGFYFAKYKLKDTNTGSFDEFMLDKYADEDFIHFGGKYFIKDNAEDYEDCEVFSSDLFLNGNLQEGVFL